MDIEISKSYVEESKKTLADAQREVDYANEEMGRRGDFYISEMMRREDDNKLIDDLIKLFKSTSSSMTGFLQTKMEAEVNADNVFAEKKEKSTKEVKGTAHE